MAHVPQEAALPCTHQPRLSSAREGRWPYPLGTHVRPVWMLAVYRQWARLAQPLARPHHAPVCDLAERGAVEMRWPPAPAAEPARRQTVHRLAPADRAAPQVRARTGVDQPAPHRDRRSDRPAAATARAQGLGLRLGRAVDPISGAAYGEGTRSLAPLLRQPVPLFRGRQTKRTITVEIDQLFVVDGDQQIGQTVTIDILQ